MLHILSGLSVSLTQLIDKEPLVGSLEPANSHETRPPRTRRKREEKGSRDVVKTTLHYITRRSLQGPCRVTVGRSPKLTDRKNSSRCGSFQ
ncbi:hypothetical protein AVEN_72335-1 [Araneus ventricosus]|uniref:Uncharacterized protein n=1 Tax=Araneus ventricosus TaxID=182803 RepID=A0A4Y2SMF3_ARAVE|nr:hypothetical protein AVEN_251107-1 [Araneus ventricosus]GBN88790.1 hypothetical protein AVEN_72335-1 [Araneus ventricosus]